MAVQLGRLISILNLIAIMEEVYEKKPFRFDFLKPFLS